MRVSVVVDGVLYQKIETLQVSVNDRRFPSMKAVDASQGLMKEFKGHSPSDIPWRFEYVVETPIAAPLHHHTQIPLHTRSIEKHNMRAPQRSVVLCVRDERKRKEHERKRN